METNYDEEELINAILAKNREGYERVYHHLGGVLYGIILRAVRVENAAKTLFTEVMVDLWQHIGEYEKAKMDLLRWIIARIVRPKILQFKAAETAH